MNDESNKNVDTKEFQEKKIEYELKYQAQFTRGKLLKSDNDDLVKIDKHTNMVLRLFLLQSDLFCVSVFETTILALYLVFCIN